MGENYNKVSLDNSEIAAKQPEPKERTIHVEPKVAIHFLFFLSSLLPPFQSFTVITQNRQQKNEYF